MTLPQTVRKNHPQIKILMLKIPVYAAGGLLFRFINESMEILLILRNDRWDLPKGKVEKNESLPMAAVREVAEETGSSLPSIVAPLGTTQHSYEMEGVFFDKTTYWYSMIFTAPVSFVPQKEEGIEQVKWVEVDQALKILGFENLQQLAVRFLQQMQTVKA